MYLHRLLPIAKHNEPNARAAANGRVTKVWPNVRYVMLGPHAKFEMNPRNPVGCQVTHEYVKFQCHGNNEAE